MRYRPLNPDDQAWYPVIDQGFGPTSSPIIVDPDFPRGVCRFCEREAGAVTFRKEAHAIPAALGNKNVISKSECDECNRKYGESIEIDLANFLGPLRTIFGIQGRKGVPTFRRRIETSAPIRYREKNTILMNEEGTDDAVILHPGADGESLACDIEYPPFELASVGRALARMALFHIRAGKHSSFRHILEWVRGDVPWQPTIYEVMWGGGVSPEGLFSVLAPPLEERDCSMIVCCVFACMAYLLPLPKNDWTSIPPNWSNVLRPFMALRTQLKVKSFVASDFGRITMRRTIHMAKIPSIPTASLE